MHVVVDPGMIGRGGHHLAINRFLFQETKKRGIRAIVLISKFFTTEKQDGFWGIPTFTYSPYTLQGHFMDILKQFVVFNEETRISLERRLPSKRLPRGSSFIVHTAFGCMLHGLLEYLSMLERDDIHVRIVLRFPPRGAQGGEGPNTV